MKISYNKLWKRLIDEGMQKQNLVDGAGLSSATVAKMGKGIQVSERSLKKICTFLHCEKADIVDYLDD